MTTTSNLSPGQIAEIASAVESCELAISETLAFLTAQREHLDASLDAIDGQPRKSRGERIAAWLRARIS